LRDKEKTVPQVLIAKDLLKNIKDNQIRDFLLLALSGTVSDVARRTSEKFLDAFRKRLNDLYLRIFLFQRLNENLKINLGRSKTYVADARNMKEIASASIDGIVTSPPYAVALDYIKNDYPQLVILELADIESLEKAMMGSPRVDYSRRELMEQIKSENLANFSKTGSEVVNYLISKGRRQAGLRSFKFFIDMIEALREMWRVLKENCKCAIIIGNNHFKVGGKYVEVPNDKVLLEIAENLGFEIDRVIGRKLQKSSEGIIREEVVLVLRKSGR
jgi:DNA modification methylase